MWIHFIGWLCVHKTTNKVFHCLPRQDVGPPLARVRSIYSSDSSETELAMLAPGSLETMQPVLIDPSLHQSRLIQPKVLHLITVNQTEKEPISRLSNQSCFCIISHWRSNKQTSFCSRYFFFLPRFLLSVALMDQIFWPLTQLAADLSKCSWCKLEATKLRLEGAGLGSAPGLAVSRQPIMFKIMWPLDCMWTWIELKEACLTGDRQPGVQRCAVCKDQTRLQLFYYTNHWLLL